MFNAIHVQQNYWYIILHILIYMLYLQGSQIIYIDIFMYIYYTQNIVHNHRLQACLDPMLTPLLSNDCYNFVIGPMFTLRQQQEIDCSRFRVGPLLGQYLRSACQRRVANNSDHYFTLTQRSLAIGEVMPYWEF